MLFLEKVQFLQKIITDLFTLSDYFESRRAVALMQATRAINISLTKYVKNDLPDTPEPEMTHQLHKFRKDLITQIDEMHQVFLSLLGSRSFALAFKAMMMKFSVFVHYHRYKNKIDKYYEELKAALNGPQPAYERIDYDAIEKDKRENPWKYTRPKYDKGLFPKKRIYSPFEVSMFFLHHYPRGCTVVKVTTEHMVLGNGSDKPIHDDYSYEWKLDDFTTKLRQGYPLILLL